jgi:hypothetical protein
MNWRVLISSGTALISWLLAWGYSHFCYANPYLKESLQHLGFAFRLVSALQWILLWIPVAGLVYALIKRGESKHDEIFSQLLISFSILWPLVVLVAWEIQKSPFIDLRGIR